MNARMIEYSRRLLKIFCLRRQRTPRNACWERSHLCPQIIGHHRKRNLLILCKLRRRNKHGVRWTFSLQTEMPFGKLMRNMKQRTSSNFCGHRFSSDVC